MTVPDLGWQDLVVALLSAFVGWLSRALNLFKPRS